MKQLIETLKSLIEDANKTTDRLAGKDDRATYEQYRGRRQAYQKILRVVEAMDTEPTPNTLSVGIMDELRRQVESNYNLRIVSEPESNGYHFYRGRQAQAERTLEIIAEFEAKKQ